MTSSPASLKVCKGPGGFSTSASSSLACCACITSSPEDDAAGTATLNRSLYRTVSSVRSNAFDDARAASIPRVISCDLALKERVASASGGTTDCVAMSLICVCAFELLVVARPRYVLACP